MKTPKTPKGWDVIFGVKKTTCFGGSGVSIGGGDRALGQAKNQDSYLTCIFGH